MPEDPTEKKPTEPSAPTAAAPIDAKSATAGEPKPEPPVPEPTTAEAAADADEDEEGDERDETDSEDAFRPEAIAKRIDKLGGETEVERQAREEEQKLAERRRAQKKKGKRGLESAASKKLAKIGDKPVKRVAASTAVAADADPLLERTVKLNQWMRDHQRVVGFGVAALVLGAAGLMGWTYFQQKKETDASMVLAAAIADERGRIGDPEKEKDDPDKPKDPRPLFKTIELRRDAALAKYKEVESRFSGTGAAMLARLGEGSILLDKQDADGAIGAFNDVKASPLAQADVEVRGRALEGLGFAYEIKAQKVQEQRDQRDKLLDEALKAFKELELTDVRGFKELGMYHQARVFQAKDDKPKAIEILTALRTRLQAKPNEPGSFPYLDTVVDDRLATLDPSAVPRKPAHGGMGMGGGGMGGLESLIGPDGNIDTSDPRVMQMIQQQMQQQMQQKGGMPQPPMPPPGKGPPPPPPGPK